MAATFETLSKQDLGEFRALGMLLLRGERPTHAMVEAYDDLASMLYRRSLISFDEFLAAQDAFALGQARIA